MTLQQLKTKADARLVTFWQALVPKQEAYRTKHGHFFQLLVTPNLDVVDGEDSVFEVRLPSDETHVVDVDFAFAETIPFNICVDTFVTVNSTCFSATVLVQLPNGDRYTRTRTYEVPHPTFTGSFVPGGEDTRVQVQGEPVQNDTGWSKITPPQF